MTPTPLTRRDGRIDRRRLLHWAAGLAAGNGLMGLTGLTGLTGGLALGTAHAANPFKIGWVRPTTGRLASSYAPL